MGSRLMDPCRRHGTLYGLMGSVSTPSQGLLSPREPPISNFFPAMRKDGDFAKKRSYALQSLDAFESTSSWEGWLPNL